MGRPRKWASEAERKRAQRGTVRPFTPEYPDENTTYEKMDTCPDINWHPEIDVKVFDGIGRGIPVNGFVLVSRRSEPNGNTQHGVVTEKDWKARLNKRCSHGLMGWSCKECL